MTGYNFRSWTWLSNRKISIILYMWPISFTFTTGVMWSKQDSYVKIKYNWFKLINDSREMNMTTYFWRSPLAMRLLSLRVNLPNRCNILSYCRYLNCCYYCYYAYYMNFRVHCCNMIAFVTANEWNLRIWLEFYAKEFFWKLKNISWNLIAPQKLIKIPLS